MRFLGLPIVALGAMVFATDLADATPAAAQWVRVEFASGGDRLVPLEDVFAMLRTRYTGDHIGSVAKLPGAAGAILYEVMWLTRDGRKLVFLVDAKSGQVVSTKGAP